MAECTHDCSTCSENCGERKESFLEKTNDASHVKKVIGVVSGKGGVGKSMVTALLAVESAKQGKKVGILDADITGPSIPKMFGIHEKATSDGTYLHPAVTKSGIKIMSMNLLLAKEEDPVVWRGPVIAGAVKQFWTDTLWDELDVLYVDMPPGTGDVPLTVFQSLPVDGIIVVTSPQDLVSMIVKKAVRMAGLMDKQVLSLVENMSYFICPNCKEKHFIFGDGKVDKIAFEYGIDTYSQMPIDPSLANLADEGRIEEAKTAAISNTVDRIF